MSSLTKRRDDPAPAHFKIKVYNIDTDFRSPLPDFGEFMALFLITVLLSHNAHFTLKPSRFISRLTPAAAAALFDYSGLHQQIAALTKLRSLDQTKIK